MTLSNQSNIAIFLRQLELSSGHKLSYPKELAHILEIASREAKTHLFENLIFHAKFIVKTQEVMNRVGSKADGFEKLASEVQSSMYRALELIRNVIESDEQKEEFENKFFSLETESLSQFMKLLSDLSWIKNWQVDGKPLPYETNSAGIFGSQTGSKKKEIGERASTPLVRIQICALSGVILFVLLLFIDPPVTIFGWILSLGISLFLVYIVLQIYLINRPPKS